MLEAGQKAPEFSLKDEKGIVHNLKDYKGKNLILYFYPKDDTPGCTIEACSFRDNFVNLSKSVTVLGIGKGSASDHRKFIEKYSLPFSLLVDEGLNVCREYEVLKEKSMFGKSYDSIMRTTFLIDTDGNIAKVWENVNPLNHANEILEQVKGEAQQ